jgi:heme oxygenase (biliverdin-IX-beta and delta-forming)
MADDRREEAARAAQARVDAGGGAAAARALLRAQGAGVLTTLSARRPGYPSASVVTFAVSAAGEPLLLLSAIAQHTRNLEADPRACLLVLDLEAAAKDARTAARLAVYGRVGPVAPAEEADARARAVARHPSARGLLEMDFRLHRLEVEEAQWVGGFAAAGWITAAELTAPDGGAGR